MEGIDNLGGTCAINSLIQIIIRNNHLRSTILNSSTPPNTLTSELKEVINLVYNEKKSIAPHKFINFFFETFKNIFKRYEEIDINELWLFVYNKIFEETSIEIEPPSTNDKPNYDTYLHNDKKTSHLTNLVQGIFANIIECSNCNHQSISFEPFISMSLDIIEHQSIANLIINNLGREVRDADDWKCERCEKKCPYSKFKKIWKLPKILFISLNRFKDIYNKDNSLIFINKNLNFVSINQIYNLQGLGLHYGNLMGGHYIALCDMKDDTYNLYNDNIVKSYNTNDIIKELEKNNTAYLMIYELE